MPHFFCRLTPPRALFSQDMTEEERALMGEHVSYVRGEQARGRVVVFGPVADPLGGWGMAVIEVADREDADRFAAGDPVVRSGRGFRYDILPMPAAFARAAAPTS